MHGEGGTHALWLVSLLCEFQIFTEHWTIIRVRTVFDNLLGTAQRTLATKIGYSLLSNDDIHIMLSAVHMAAHRNNGRDATILGGTLRGEDRNVTIALVIAGAADTVHQLAAADMAGVLIAVDITLDSGVHSDDTQSANHLRRVRNLALTNGEMLLEVINIIIHFFQCIIGYGERSAGSILDSSLAHVFHHGILNHLGINAEYRHVRILSQSL